MSATVSAGQTAQYQLQLTPGAGFAGTVSLSCTGAPLAATCQLPSTVSLAGGAAATFTVNVATSGPAELPPLAPLRFKSIPSAPVFPFVALALLLLLFTQRREVLAKSGRAFGRYADRSRFALCGVLSVAILCVFLGAGCGSGAAAVAPTTAPPPVVTPSGTSTITIALGANSSSGQPLQLPPVQLSLTVK